MCAQEKERKGIGTRGTMTKTIMDERDKGQPDEMMKSRNGNSQLQDWVNTIIGMKELSPDEKAELELRFPHGLNENALLGSCEVQDMTEAISRLMNGTDSMAEIRTSLAHVQEHQVIQFFDHLVESVERVPIAGETVDEFEFRRRETSLEHRTSYLKYRQKSFQVREKFLEGDKFYRDHKYVDAYTAFCDAIFACEARPLAEFSEHYSNEFEGKKVPFNLVYLNLKMKQIESLLLAKDYERASIYSHALLNWMTVHSARDVAGYFASYHSESYSLLQIWMGEAEISLGNHHRAIDKCSVAIRNFCRLKSTVALERSIYSVRQNFFEQLIESYEKGGDMKGVPEDRAKANIIVSQQREKGFEKGQFILNDLVTALRIAKNGDTIFLEEGTYTNGTMDPNHMENSEKKVPFEIRKAVCLIGCSASKCIISGSIVKWGSSAVLLKRLKLEVGLDIDSNEDIYFMDGVTVLEDCVIESPVNTCMYVISPNFATETTVKFRHCIFDGLGNCKRMLCFQGPRPRISIDSCCVNELYSFITVITPEEKTSAIITVADSVFYDLQDGLKIIVHHESNLVATMIGCQFDLIKYDQDCPSHAFSMTGGTTQLQGNMIYCSHLDSIGFSLHSLKRVDIDMNLIETGAEIPRALALGQGVVLSENLNVNISSTEIIGLRIGFQISNQFKEMNHCILRDCSAKQCSLGLFVKCAEPENTSTSEINQELTVFQCHFDSCYYALMCDDLQSKIDVINSSFYDIPKPLLIAKLNLLNFNARGNEYKLSRDFHVEGFVKEEDNSDEATNHKTSHSELDAKRQQMYLYFATKENLPHRMAIDVKHFQIIGSANDETELMQKYKMFRESPLIE